MTSTAGQCPNCSAPLFGQFCSECGQNQKGSDRYFWTLVNEAFEGLFSFNSKAWKTVLYMLFRPGLLTQEHFANRRARYISPLRLYIITSIALFLALSVITFFKPTLGVQFSTTEQKTGIEQQTENNAEGTAQTNTKISLGLSKIFVSLPFVSEDRQAEINAALQQKLDDAIQVGKDRPKLIVNKIIDSSPGVILLLLPLFALVLKLFYLKSDRFYSQHLVLALHNHSFLFTALIFVTALPLISSGQVAHWLGKLAWVWIALYMPFSLKRSFKQGWPITLTKSIVLFFIYTLLFVLALAGASLIGLLLL